MKKIRKPKASKQKAMRFMFMNFTIYKYSAAMVSRIYLLRHGETEWTISGRHTGITDVPLTAHGEEEACALGKRLHDVSFQRVLSSPRLRARRTCELAGMGAPEVDDNLREWDYGQYEGLLTREILARHPGWKIFEDGCPGGESPAQVSARADRLLASVRQMEGNVAHLFSHGHFTARAGRALGQSSRGQRANFGVFNRVGEYSRRQSQRTQTRDHALE